ncbi:MULTISPECIES: hypothetical protein [Reichenbachiella]|uniref:Lipoprotein n=1 Tax=Reichenbachiella agariperforans TaxID=156994 RepID=A0A1M6V0X4_REIAG|nr:MULTISPECIES: hypothetical protein [Reichenbachiella]MBU2912398.1 hypothetical protein [Reichenbachiella agariperforans]RJE72731.1 hypothetical protein BGP76_01840 [Reichenbachiella sp. MSK19-1]SHK74966.1 hypothetical protein SAMN04488028_10871 [Reichenbachiella agariperforans]
MNIFKRTFQYLIVIFTLIACVPNPKKLGTEKADAPLPSDDGYSIIFYEINNYALIYVNDELYFDTRKNPETEKEPTMVKLPSNTIKLRLDIYNAECITCTKNSWEVVYELYKDGIALEYVTESSDGKHTEVGIVNSHTLNLEEK